jgi:hypothetical protein
MKTLHWAMIVPYGDSDDESHYLENSIPFSVLKQLNEYTVTDDVSADELYKEMMDALERNSYEFLFFDSKEAKFYVFSLLSKLMFHALDKMDEENQSEVHSNEDVQFFSLLTQDENGSILNRSFFIANDDDELAA